MSLTAMSLRKLAQAGAGLPLKRQFSTSSTRAAAYGFIGLGRMGYPMARNLRSKIAAGDTLVVNDVNVDAAKKLVAEVGGNTTVAKDVRQVAEQSDTIVTSLPEPKHVKQVFETILKGGKLPATSDSSLTRIYIDCSTIDPITSRNVAKQVADAGEGAFIDSPMSGGVVGAEAGSLTFMLGCPKSQVERAETVLSLMGKRIIHLGDQGAGLCGKLANNYLLAITNIATAEAMSMGIQWGLDPKALAGMINTSTGRCWPSEINNPVPGVLEVAPSNRGYEGGFGIALMEKDLGLALTSAKEFGVKYGLGDKAIEMYKAAAQDERCKGKDFSSIYRWLEGPA